MIYICSPFTSKKKSLELLRYNRVQRYVAHLMKKGEVPFSPIVYCYPIHLKYSLPGHAAYWKSFNEHMMRKCDEMHVLMLEGWQDSVGVQAEIQWWSWRRSSSFPLRYIEGKRPWQETTPIG